MTGQTTALRGLVAAQLETVPGEVYHKKADKNAAYPYKTYSVERVNVSDLSRDDYSLCVDIWDRAQDWKAVETLADQITQLFNAANLPQDTILPTFYRDSSYPVEDPDKELQHWQLHFIVQLYPNE